MNVTLTSQLEEIIRRQVESGRYSSAEEVVQKAVQQLDAKEKPDHLRALIQVGVDEAERGELIEFTPALMLEIEREAEEAFLRGEIPDPEVCP